ncbi:MAG: branched-chain amino acid ABC transporter permease [Desulfuromonas sp.]|nr:MAG: branched-chain amino acid ABC transporter permease [Desulfuromonas sp.]
MSRSAETKAVLYDGFAAAWPICLGYFPIGMALGVLARQAGLTPLDMALMSLLVFAGSAQFIAVAMLAAGSSPGAIIATTFVVNFRHVLMSSALAVHLHGISKRFLMLFAYGVNDESFAVNMARFRDGQWDRWRALVVHHSANGVWFIATVTGCLVGSLIPAGAFGIDFALPAMFLALLVLQFQSRIHVITAILAAAVSVLCVLYLPGDSHAVIAAVVAASIGYLLQRRKPSGREGTA